MINTLLECQQLDQADPLRGLRDLFDIPNGVTYFCGNSLGAMPKSAGARFDKTIKQEWGVELIRAWNTAGWFDLPRELGNRLAPLIGAKKDEVVVTDSTSVNLYKVLFAAMMMVKRKRSGAGADKRNVILSERSNFPTDLYIAEALCSQHGFELRLIEPEELSKQLTDEVAVLMLTHVNYRTGAMLDMQAVTAAAQKQGALTIWDLAHSAGAVSVDLNAANADFAVGCTYKFLNGGPGSPAFLWVNEKHINEFEQPLSGWWGHAAPFEMDPHYTAATGITRYLCGTQGIVSMVGVDTGLAVFEAAEKLGGMSALRKKSLALTDLFIHLVQQRCAGFGLEVVTPMEHADRGSQVSLSKTEGAYEIMKALIKRGVIGDFRKGDGKQHIDILRFGVTPLYLGYADVWHAVETLHHILTTEEWRLPEFAVKSAVT